MASPTTKTTFAAATAVKQLTPNTYSAFFHDDWCIGTVPHGGYITSCFQQVALAHFGSTLSKQNQPDTISLHLEFLRRTQTGFALFTVSATKLGRQASVVHISLTQPNDPSTRPPYNSSNSREEVVGYFTHGNLATESGITLDAAFSLHPPTPTVNIVALQDDKDEHWARQPSMPFAGFRKATQKVNFHFPRDGQAARAIGDEWCCFQNGEKFTNASLGFICDMFPMPVEAFRDEKNPYDVTKDGSNSVGKEAAYWYPTLLLNLEIKKSLPLGGVDWLFCRVRAKEIKNGRMDLELIIMDTEGDIVALSNHICFVLPASRNTAKRRDTSKI